MKSKENGLTVCSFIFGVIAVVMIAVPYIAMLLVHDRIVETGGNAKFGSIAFFITYGLVMMAFGFFSWVASMVLMIVSGIETILGRIVVVLNAVCLSYYAFVIYMIMRH